jgi:Metallo-peptidase family M12B Reprolysin-like/Secretion system C-terminal sorting domain
MKKALLLALSFVLISMVGFTQTGKYWSSHIDMGGKITTDKAVTRQSFPKSFKLFDLNISLLRQDLFSIVGNQSSRRSTIISLPNADGQIEQFEVFEASNFEPALQAMFPEIRAYSGKGVTDKSATLKLSVSQKGIQTMIFRTERENEFIEAYSQDHSVYAVFKSQRTKGNLPWTCSTEDKEMFSDITSNITSRPESSAGELKVMRLAQSCNGEYSTFFGAAQTGTTIADTNIVLAAFNATLTRCNGVYEKDLALHLNLIPQSRFVIFFNPATDPYTTLGAWNGQLQSTLTAVIGAANYDIGHMFGASGGGGNAGCIGCVCDALKGSGITSPADGIPQGDNFDIDYVVHEVGHQLGGTHTFSMSTEAGGLTNKEVGSGITIMGYAGITNQDVAPHSIDIFHEVSITQIQNNLAPKTCPITTNITANNATPVVAPLTNRIIPISTPFALTGSATDANAGDVLTYCWEQDDSGNAGTTGNNSVAIPTKTSGPNWLSFRPTTNPTRTFPILATILAGNFVTGPLPGGDAIANIEALSSVARTLNFRLTVRDNAPYVSDPPASRKVGQTAFTDVVVTVDGTSGPFQVTAPNTAVSYFAGSTQNITWSVNNTTAPPVSCANVKISISTDGGLTFPTVLAASTPNDGTEALTIPATLTTTARIKVEAVGNIFFDISNTNFSITTPPTDFNFGTTVATTSVCPAAATLAVTIPTTQTGGFANPITLAATTGVPAGTTVSFGTNPVAPGSSSVATLNNANTLNAGTYVIGVSGTATGASVKNTTITFIITAGAGPVLTTNTLPATVCAPATASFTVATAAAPVTYQWQSAPTVGGTYTNITGATSASYTTAATTVGMNGMGFRCVVSTQCGSTTSANALLTVNTAAAITTQPVSTTACTGATATFTTAATGTGVSYQWQSATAAAGPWTNVGTNSTSYTTAPLTVTTPTFYQVVVTTTTCPATVTSNVVTLGVSVTTAIGTQPSAQTVCVGATATYTVAATGTSVVYQWQSATSAGGPWTNVGTNSNTYTTAATTVGMNGMFFQVIVTGTCNAVTSAPMMLTVNTAAAITTQPTAVTLCNGVAATFTAAGSGTGVTYQWQSGPSATGPWTNVVGGTGATTTTYTTAATTPAMNGTYYRMVATTTTCALVVNSNAVLLTVNTVAVIGTQPTAQSACIPQTATFNVAATGTGLTYQWQVALAATPTVFTDIAGATSASYTTVPSVLTMNGNVYRVNILSTCSPTTPTTSAAVVLTVTNPVAITLQPAALSGCATDNYTFTATATSPGNTITYQWQASNTGNPGTFTNIAGPGASGTASATANVSYVINNAPQFLNGTFYRVYFSVPCGTGISADTSRAGKLTLSLRPTVELTKAATSNLNPAVNSALTTTVSPAGGNFVYNWKKNGTTIPNTLATTSITIPVDDNNKYDVTITDPSTGCVSLLSTLTTSALTSDNLVLNQVFTFPNPVSNILYVRFNTSNLAARGTMLNIYDEKASKVFSAAYNITGTNGRMQVDMSKLPMGTYIVYIMDANGKKLASSKVVKVQ